MSDEQWTPQFSVWRHGGWYVDNVRYISGAVGCVSRNYPDRKWRIACDSRFDVTYPNRDAAARAERVIAQAERERVLSNPQVGDTAVCADCSYGIEYKPIPTGPLAGSHAIWQHNYRSEGDYHMARVRS